MSVPTRHVQSGSTTLRQRGVMLIILAFLLGLAATALLLHASNDFASKIDRDEKTFNALEQAKTALIGWSVNHPMWPGLMPFPDRSADGNYDGQSDCPGGPTNYSHLIGRLPWKAGDYADCGVLLPGLGKEFRDGSDEPLWYAVSRNLVHSYSPVSDPIINPGIIDNPTYPWMQVLDKKGNVVSDRVAAVIIAPGPPLPSQNRSSGIAGPAEYLDRFRIGAVTYSNRTYAMPDEDFVMGEDDKAIRSDDALYEQPYEFNDKLVYITIDELMAEVTKRVAGDAKTVLKAYFSAQGRFPYAAPLGTSSGYVCKDNTLEGMLPIGPSAAGTTCNCTVGAAFSCTCSFGAIGNVAYTRSGASTWAVPPTTIPASAVTAGVLTPGNPNLCTRPTTQTCLCTGPGFCQNTTGSRWFRCRDDGVTCEANTTGTYTFSGMNVDSASGGCSLAGGCGSTTVTCSTTGSFTTSACSDPPLSSLPAWFSANKWQDFFYYRLSRSSPTMTVGNRSGIQALLVGTGKPITSSPFVVAKGSAQVRPSCALNDYLDSLENTNADLVFDAPNTPRTRQYNDQVFIVAP
ncbi:MAG: hypothetical protein N2Z69_00370 [Methylophilaceae bacterium]|nr:hypothetical protein [Methylophilaceae bacterium]